MKGKKVILFVLLMPLFCTIIMLAGIGLVISFIGGSLSKFDIIFYFIVFYLSWVFVGYWNYLR